jgi:hypothetical protein
MVRQTGRNLKGHSRSVLEMVFELWRVKGLRKKPRELFCFAGLPPSEELQLMGII